ncbi:caprin-2-like [Ruditapes philippinarum]|uniref:caprin-2-like n=1 Tax=Ruditapes philippinarum TaxID=129788 RepID=UPI00295A86F9|nr:caprin-2-like [Ruditapes philippinarum]
MLVIKFVSVSGLLAVLAVVLTAVLTVVLAADDDSDDDLTYEAKLLDRMIHMETRLERLDKTLEATKTIIKTTIQDQTNFLNNKTAQIELLKAKIDFPLVAFNAHSPRDYSPDTNQIYIWSSTLVNEGNAYDTNTGIFKAPVSGLYYFAVHTCNYAGATNIYAIVKEEKDIATSYQHDNAVNDCTSMNSITNVTAGERVWVRCTSGSTSNQLWESSGRSSFIGALIRK